CHRSRFRGRHRRHRHRHPCRCRRRRLRRNSQGKCMPTIASLSSPTPPGLMVSRVLLFCKQYVLICIQNTWELAIGDGCHVARSNPVGPLEGVLIGKVREVAEAKGMPMSHVSARAGISRSSMWEVMNGRASPTLDWVQRVAEVLDVDPLELLQGKPV